MNCRTLLSAQDAGAATQMLALAAILNRAGGFEVCAYAADPAHGIFERGGLRHGYVSSLPPEALLPLTEGAVEAFQPDIVIAGLSSVDHNIDAAFLAAQQRRRGADAMLLDDRGPIQAMSARSPGLLLAVNDAILQWAESHCDGRVVNIGSPKAAAWRHLPLAELRRRTRREFGLAEGDIALVYSLQTDSLPGHRESFAVFAEAFAAARRSDERLKLVLRGHPAYPGTRRAAGELLQKLALPFLDGDTTETVALLAAGDAIATCNSTLAEDYQFIAAAMQRPGLAFYLAVSAELRRWYVAQFDDTAPVATRGKSARLIVTEGQLSAALQELLRGAGVVMLLSGDVDPDVVIPDLLLEVVGRG